jgi:hypothetical protein
MNIEEGLMNSDVKKKTSQIDTHIIQKESVLIREVCG